MQDMDPRRYTFKLRVWIYPGEAAWHFVTLPQKESEMIREVFSEVKRGWGSLPVKVTVGETTWNTSIFPDRKRGAYLMPLKAEVRKKESIHDQDEILLQLEIKAGELY